VPHQRPGRFRLSQRAPYVGGVMASSTLTVPVGKPMVMARDEPLADPRRFRRLQVVCGDASLAHTASLLKIGSTAVALRLIHDGAAPTVSLDDPVTALHVYSADPTLRATAPSDRGQLRATDVQRLWLEAALAHQARGRLPEPEAAVLDPWDDVLTLLERDPTAAADRVDWVAKHTVLDRLVEREGMGWDDPRVVAADLAYHDVRPDRSIYGRLVSSGLMRSLVDAETVARLCTDPPATTRALTRGTLIRLIRRCGFHYEVNWTTCQFNVGSVRVEVQLDDPSATGTPDAEHVIARLHRELEGRRGAPANLNSASGSRAAAVRGEATGSRADVSEVPWGAPDDDPAADGTPRGGWWASVAG
jgi:pup-ligase protein